MMVDPDAGIRREVGINGLFKVNPDSVWLHWLKMNIKLGEGRDGNEVMSYSPPKPPLGSGEHRYYFLVLLQPDKIEKGKMADAARANFPAKKFIDSVGLKLVDHVMFRTEASIGI